MHVSGTCLEHKALFWKPARPDDHDIKSFDFTL